jgi:hypothetical protein
MFGFPIFWPERTDDGISRNESCMRTTLDIYVLFQITAFLL